MAVERHRHRATKFAAYRGLTETTKDAIRSMIDGSRNYLFRKHPRRHALDSLHQMLPVLSIEPASTAWFGGFKAAVEGKTERKAKRKAAVVPVSAAAAPAKKNELGSSTASSASTHSPEQNLNAGESKSARERPRAKEKKKEREDA